MADPQDEIVANFTQYVTVDTLALIDTIKNYHRPLGNCLFDITGLDEAHRDEIKLVSKMALRLLRQRLEALAPTLALAQQAGEN